MTNYIVNMLTAIKIKHMKLSFLFLLILCSCSNTPQKNNVTNATDEALIAVENKYDLGEINKKEHQFVDFAFEIENISDSTIKISKTELSCGCLSLTDTLSVIKPHSKAKFHGKVNTTEQRGYLNKSIFVNYGKNKVMLLRVKGNIIEK